MSIDGQFESIVHRFHQQYSVLSSYDEEGSMIGKTLLIDKASPEEYLINFQWNEFKYRHDTPLPELISSFTAEMKQMDTAVKGSFSSFQSTRASFLASQRKKSGNLAVRPINPKLLSDSCCNLMKDSEFVDLCLLAVPR